MISRFNFNIDKSIFLKDILDIWLMAQTMALSNVAAKYRLKNYQNVVKNEALNYPRNFFLFKIHII